MEVQQRCSKRLRTCEDDRNKMGKSLLELVQENLWEDAIIRTVQHPEEALNTSDPSPLAIACRTGAPYECIKVIVEAAPNKLRNVLDSRGTPLHEAIVCESTTIEVIDILLKIDETLGNETTRATLLQDVDGFTPLHLLIRRRFQTHILNPDNNNNDDDTQDEISLYMKILEMLVISCPEAVIIPDRGEYEEPPIVYAIKANMYAPLGGGSVDTDTVIERQIYEMVHVMLKHAPFAAGQVFNGFRGQYSALHSAVFHGRYTSTVELLIQTEQTYNFSNNNTQTKAALLTNTQLELPLHFCTMRGERPRTVDLLANAAPEAVLKRDSSGLTPYHWLWSRFVSTMLSLEDDRRGEDITVNLRSNAPVPYRTNQYNEFTTIEQGDFEIDLQLIRRLDPPVDFLRMRHIPEQVSNDDGKSLLWAKRCHDVLERIRERYKNSNATEEHIWTRQEAVIGLFWTKAVSLLEAAAQAGDDMPMGSFLVHTAFGSPCCPPPVSYIAASLFPEHMRSVDGRGRLPIHYAACRPWHAWDWPLTRDNGINEPASCLMLNKESLEALRIAIDLSPRDVMRVADHDNRLVVHHAIDTFVKACSQPARSTEDCMMGYILKTLQTLVASYPESLHRRDGRTMLYPFIQATAVASEQQDTAYVNDELSLSVTFMLLRENPTVLKSI